MDLVKNTLLQQICSTSANLSGFTLDTVCGYSKVQWDGHIVKNLIVNVTHPPLTQIYMLPIHIHCKTKLVVSVNYLVTTIV